MNFIRKILSVGVFAFYGMYFGACSLLENFEIPTDNTEVPVLEPTKFKILLIDSPNLKYYDFVSIKYGKKHNFDIDLYKLGRNVGSINITQNEICMSKKCTSKWLASRWLFGDVSYPNLFPDILAARDIFDGEGKRVGNDGSFVQWFVRGGEEFYYERIKNRVFFKNLTRNIVVQLEDYIANTQ